MLPLMTMLKQRWRVAGWSAAVLMSTTAAGVRAEGEPAAAEQTPSPARTVTTKIVSTEGGGTVTAAPTMPSAPNVPTAPLAAPSGASPVGNPDANASSEPPSPSEYDAAADTDPAALDDFRDTLSPYGTWEDDANYGVVWMPSSVVVGADFAPYVSHGHWGLTASSSWLWVSDFSWGWAPFHYGRWVWIGGRGWGWIPGRVYSPAWVVWRTGFYDDYYVGWAPMPPTWYWHGGWAVRLGYVPYAPYVFCSSTHVFAPHVRPYLAPPARVGLIGPRTQPYVAAAPGVASTGHSPITMTRGPSMADAHIPMGSIPVQRVTPEARAVAFAQSRPQARPYASPQGGPLMGRGDMYGRTPGSSVPTTRPSGPGPQVYAPRPLSPAAAPMQPAMPVLPRPSPVMPSSTPRPYMPSAAVPQFNRPTPGSDFARPAPAPDFARSAPVIRPSAPAPVVRPSSPPPSVSRPSAAPHVSPSRPAAVPRNFSR